MRKTRLAAVAVLPALLLAAGCSSGSSDSDAKSTPTTSSSGSSGSSASSSTGDATASGDAPLTKTQLTSALVTDADVPGYTVQVSQTTSDDATDTSTLATDKPDCQPLADITSSKPKIPRVAFVGAAFAKVSATASPSATPDEINEMLVASHKPGDAQKVVESVKTALKTCTTFTTTDSSGTKTPFSVAKGPAVPTGDSAVSYVMTDTSDATTGAALVTVVQTGDTITAYISVKSAGGVGDLPIDVARKQNEKLKAALAK
ncbi:MAG: hypothetical protein QOF98_1350 [Streptomyces sp.]|jgi:hypothetical protein|nr:hypothetical protein [Streptomyces sp.]